MKPRTRIVIALDRSTSMGDDRRNPNRRKETVEGYNGQVREILTWAKEQDIRINLLTFNHEVFEHLVDEPAEKLTEATLESYQPAGNTAYYDGMTHGINLLDRQGLEDKDCSFLMVVISDGEENASQHSTAASVNRMIADRKATGRWTFTFMGCDETMLDKVSEAIGVSKGNMAAWSNQQAGATKVAMHRNRQGLKKYFGVRGAGGQSVNTFHSEDANVSANYAQFDTVEVSNIESLEAEEKAVLSCNVSNVFSNGNKAAWGDDPQVQQTFESKIVNARINRRMGRK